MLNKEDQDEHVKRELYFKCHKPRHRSFECSTIKRKTTTLEVKQEDGEPSKEVVPRILTLVMNMEVEQKPTVLQIKGILNYN